MTMPRQKPGQSEQVVCTPTPFLQALKDMLRIEQFDLDLAASPENAVAKRYYTEEDDSLTCEWLSDPGGWCFCNPPYEDIAPWVRKAEDQVTQNMCNVAMLLPASVGSNWWRDHVHMRAYVHFLNGRITFVGHKAPYPKDLAILLYAPYLMGGYTVWDWQ